MDWFVLGIEPTKDKKAITAAYRQKLRKTNPEDQPEEFKALRAAYEEALALADQEDVPEREDDSPVGRWIEKIREVYDDFPARIAPDHWRALMAADVCQALDTRPLAEEALMCFLMEHYFLPKEVWEVLDEAFRFTQRVDELCETYPREFVEHVLVNGVRLEQNLPYDLFEPGQSSRDCDAYRKLYYQSSAMGALDQAPILEQMDALSERHPYGEAQRMYHWIVTGREEEGLEGLRKLAEDYPDRPALVIPWATMCLEKGDASQALALAQHVLQQVPVHVGAMNLASQALASMGEYEKAKELVYEAIHACGGDPIVLNDLAERLKAWNQGMIAQLEEKLAACPEDTKSAIDLAWCHAQNEDLELARKTAEKIDAEKADPFAYHNLMGKLCYSQEDFDGTLEHMETVVDIIRGMSDDGSEEAAKRMKRLPEMLQIQGSCLMQLGLRDQGREKFREVMDLALDNSEILASMGRSLFAVGDYVYAVEVLDQMLRVSSGAWHGEMLRALCLYHLSRDGEAYEAVDRALAIQGSDLSLYVTKMQILIRNGVWDGVQDILTFLEENKAPADLSVDFIRAKVTELQKKDTKEAFRQYQKIARAVEAGEDMLWASELYCRMALLMGQTMDASRAEDRDILMATVEKGLVHNPYDPESLSYKAWLLTQGGQIREAIDIYLEMERRDPDSPHAIRGLVDLYYDYAYLCAEEALAYFEKRLAVQKTPYIAYCAATCRNTMGDYEGARKYYRLGLEMDPDYLDSHRGLAVVCEREADYDQAVSYLDKAISIMEETGRYYDWLLEDKVKILRRMGWYEDALAMVDDMMQRYDYDGFQTMFDICCQFGLWGRANGILEAWKQADKKDPRRIGAAAQLAMLTGNLFKAAVLMGTVKHKLPQDQILAFRLQLNDLECQHNRQAMHLAARVKQTPRDDNALLCMAQALWHSGQVEMARDYARKSLELVEDMLRYHVADEPLYRTRGAIALAILGREEEARAELAKSRQLPLCPMCEYCCCKDADIYEAMIEEVLGNSEKALALYRAGKEKWPDDTDFAAGIARLTKRGKKKC